MEIAAAELGGKGVNGDHALQLGGASVGLERRRMVFAFQDGRWSWGNGAAKVCDWDCGEVGVGEEKRWKEGAGEKDGVLGWVCVGLGLVGFSVWGFQWSAVEAAGEVDDDAALGALRGAASGEV